MADEPTPSDAPVIDPPAPEPTPAPAPAPDGLGDAGKAAIKAERARAAKAEREAKELKARLEEFEAQTQTEAEKLIAAARKEAAAEATSAANKRIIRAEVKALAAGRLSDPADAVAFLDLDQFEVDGDGDVDVDAITSAIEALVEQKPYLAATAKGLGTGGGGARPQTPPQSDEDRIRELEAAGDIRAAMSLKNQGLLAALMNPSS